MKNKNYTQIALSITTAVFLGLSIYFYFQVDSAKDELSVYQEGSQAMSSDIVEETENVIENNLVSVSNNNTFNISGHELTLPEGWYVNDVSINVRSQDKDVEKSISDWIVSLHKYNTLSLTNGTSTLLLKMETPIIYGGTGFVPEEISIDADVVVAPVGTDHGLVVEEIEDGYALKEIFNCNGSVERGDPCIKYGYVVGLYAIQTTFNGNDTDLETVKNFYIENILNKDFSLYSREIR